MSNITITSTSIEQTLELGSTIGRNLAPGTLISLVGNLGAGKTHLIKGIAAGLDVPDVEEVTSPTFTLMNEYEGRFMIYHLDAWRLENSDQLEAIGFDELLCGPTIVLVEWADRTNAIIDAYNPIHITIKHINETTREFTLADLPNQLAEALK